MGVDAEMFVRLATPISDDALTALCYHIAEAIKDDTFWFSDTQDLERGERQRALNRLGDDDQYYAEGLPPGDWLRVRLWGRYYGVGYERGNLWSFVQVAEWLERNIPACQVYYGGDSGGAEGLTLFDRDAREKLIAHWASNGHRPYYQDAGWHRSRAVSAPVCPLCQFPATQYGSGGDFASWLCDACGRQWIWIRGLSEPRLYDADRSGNSRSVFERTDELRAELDATRNKVSQ